MSSGRASDAFVFALAAAVVLASLLLTADLDAVYLRGEALPGVCLFSRFTGMRCLGCGLTRAFVLTAHLDLASALQAHPLGPLLWALTAAQLPYRAWRLRAASSPAGPSRTD